jgi:drug/metabolite transporter (DMT)-like permease
MIDPKFLAMVTAVSFGVAPVFLKVAFRRGGAMTIGLVIGQAVTVLFNLALIPFIDPRFDLLTPPSIVAFALGGLAGTAIGRRWVYESINLLGPSRATTIRSSSPVISALLAMVLLQEEVGPARWAAILAVVLGAALVSWTPGGGARAFMGIGVVYAMAASVIYGVRPLVVKFGLDQADAPLAAACIGATTALLYTLIFEDRSQLLDARINAAFIWFLVSAACQAIGIISLTFGLAGGDVSVVYSLVASAPVFTLVLTRVALRGVEQISWRLVIGTIAVVVGVIYL